MIDWKQSFGVKIRKSDLSNRWKEEGRKGGIAEDIHPYELFDAPDVVFRYFPALKYLNSVEPAVPYKFDQDYFGSLSLRTQLPQI